MHLISMLCVSLMVDSNYMHFFTFTSQNYHSLIINLTFDAHF